MANFCRTTTCGTNNFSAFRAARLWCCVFLLRSPALLAAVAVYTAALNLFGVEASMMKLLPLLPSVFSLPPCRRTCAPQRSRLGCAVPDNEGQMAAFGFVQHNFFILFNAAIGLLFWRRAQRDLFGS